MKSGNVKELKKAINAVKGRTCDPQLKLEYIDKLIELDEDYVYVFLINQVVKNHKNYIDNKEAVQKIIKGIFNHPNKILRAYTYMICDLFTKKQEKEIQNDILNDVTIATSLFSDRKKDFKRQTLNSLYYRLNLWQYEQHNIKFTFRGPDKYLDDRDQNQIDKIDYAVRCIANNINDKHALMLMLRYSVVSRLLLEKYQDSLLNLKLETIASKDIFAGWLMRDLYYFEEDFKPEVVAYLHELLLNKKILNARFLYKNNLSLEHRADVYAECVYNPDLTAAKLIPIIKKTKKQLCMNNIIELLVRLNKEDNHDRIDEICEAIVNNENIREKAICRIWEYKYFENNVERYKDRIKYFREEYPQGYMHNFYIPNKYINENVYAQYKIAEELAK